MWMGMASQILKHWKAGVLLLGLAAAGWGGYYVANSNCEAEKARELQALITHYTGILEKNKQINENLNEAIRKIQATERVVTERVVEYVEANPDRLDCELDSVGLSIWNSASETPVP